MAAISSFIEVLQEPHETCADCGLEPATHRLIETRNGVESRALLCKSCMDARFGAQGVPDPMEMGPCEFCGSPGAVRDGDPLQKMAGASAGPRTWCGRCAQVYYRFQVETWRALQQEVGETADIMEKLPALLAEIDRRTREYIRDHPPQVSPWVFLIPSMNGMAERIDRPRVPCDACGSAIAAYRVWTVLGGDGVEQRLCEQCLPKKEEFISSDFVPEDAVCCCCGAPASLPVADMGSPFGESKDGELFECVRCSRLGSRFLAESISYPVQGTTNDGVLERVAAVHREARQKVRDYLRDHPD